MRVFLIGLAMAVIALRKGQTHLCSLSLVARWISADRCGSDH